MPYMRGSGSGDVYVQVDTEVPVSLNREQKELIEKVREIENEKANQSIKKNLQSYMRPQKDELKKVKISHRQKKIFYAH